MTIVYAMQSAVFLTPAWADETGLQSQRQKRPPPWVLLYRHRHDLSQRQLQRGSMHQNTAVPTRPRYFRASPVTVREGTMAPGVVIPATPAPWPGGT